MGVRMSLDYLNWGLINMVLGYTRCLRANGGFCLAFWFWGPEYGGQISRNTLRAKLPAAPVRLGVGSDLSKSFESSKAQVCQI
jgi:hypothetical protein